MAAGGTSPLCRCLGPGSKGIAKQEPTMIMISNDDQSHMKVASAVEKGIVPWVPEPLGLAKLLQRK